MMKNFTQSVFVLLVIHTVQAMDVVKEGYNLTGQQCMRIALYLNIPKNKTKKDFFTNRDPSGCCNFQVIKKVKRFLLNLDNDTNKAVDFLKNIPSIKIGDMQSQIIKLGTKVKLIANELSRSNMFVFVVYNRDFVSAMFEACLPETYEDRAGFFNEKSNDQARIVDSDKPLAYPVLTKAEMISKLSDKNFEDAFAFLHFVEIKKSNLSRRRTERVVPDDSCVKVSTFKRIPPMDYQWNIEDYKYSTGLQRMCMDMILKCSNEYGVLGHVGLIDDDEDSRYVIAEKDISTLNLPKVNPEEAKVNPEEGKKKADNYVKSFILRNAQYGSAQIKVDITPSTKEELIHDKLLYCLPYALVMIVPDLVQAEISGMWHSAAGVVLCAAASFGFGEYGYPRIDSHNSHVHKLSEWYGRENHRKKRVGSDFIFMSIISSLAHIAAQKLLSWPALSWKILGGTIHVMRALISSVALIDGENRANHNPFNRRNKDGVSFTLLDLANGAKFD